MRCSPSSVSNRKARPACFTLRADDVVDAVEELLGLSHDAHTADWDKTMQDRGIPVCLRPRRRSVGV